MPEAPALPKALRDLAQAIENKVLQHMRSIHTSGLVRIETLHTKNSVPYRADVVPLWDPKASIIPGCPVRMFVSKQGIIVPSIAEGDVCWADFSFHSLDDYLEFFTRQEPTDKRQHGRIDCTVLGGYLVDSDALLETGSIFPAGFSPGDMLLLHATAGMVHFDGANNRLILGDPKGATTKKVLQDGDSNVAGGVAASQSRVWVRS